jgi:mannose-6-phosphate isomerase-like protein (cupin superfamily)
MNPIVIDIEEKAKENHNFRQVLMTGKHSQLVLMSILPGGDIGEEIHQNVDQILFIVAGAGEAIIEGVSSLISEDAVIFVEAGKKHNIKNTGDEKLQLYTIYSPPEHKDGTIHQTKEEALKDIADHY